MTANRKKLLFPSALTQAGWDVLKERDDVEGVTYAQFMPAAELRALMHDIDGVALTVTPFGAPELAAAPRLRAAARMGVGYDSVDVPALTRRGIPLMVVGTANSVTVAELAIFHMMTLAKRGAAMAAITRTGDWMARFIDRPTELYEKTLLVVGFGRIGSRVARRCVAMEMTVLVHDPYVPAEAIRAAGCEPVADFDAALPRADIVTLHCPKSPATLNLINAARLARMKPSAVVINTARGGLVDEAALHAALTAGRLAGAGLDVFASEPTPPDHPLFALPNVSVTPHAGGGTTEAGDRASVVTVRNLLSVLDGAPLREHVVNPEVLG